MARRGSPTEFRRRVLDLLRRDDPSVTSAATEGSAMSFTTGGASNESTVALRRAVVGGEG